MGLIKISDFLKAQQAAWILKANTCTRDNWRVDVRDVGYGNVCTATGINFRSRGNFILADISDCFEEIKNTFEKQGINHMESYVF